MDRTGIILYTIKYEECLEFYKKIDLTILFESDTLTCFEFGSAYLMVEIAEDYSKTNAELERIRTCSRLNVANVKVLADKLTSKNIKVDYQEHSWGTVAKFFDPDGNLCAFRDSISFEAQIINQGLS